MIRSLLVATGLGASLLAGACAPQDGFPSLALRPAERNLSFEQPERPPLAVATDPAIAGRLAQLLRQANAGDEAFRAAIGRTEAAIAGAGAPGSESWVTGQEALTRLEATRAPTMTALADLDRLRIDRSTEPTNPDDFERIEQSIEAVLAITARQQERIDALRARLSG